MRKRLLALVPLFFLMFIMPVYAETEISLLALAEQLGVRLGVGTFVGGLICSVIFLMATVMPIALINRSRKGGGNFVAELVIGVVVLGVCVGLTWLPFWFLLVIVMLLALLFSGKMRSYIGGN